MGEAVADGSRTKVIEMSYTNEECDDCNGTGRRTHGVCRECNGLGYLVIRRY